MNKTVTVNLSGIVFTLDENAYESLNKYLDAIKSHFKATENGSEIVADIESSIAEKLGEKINKNKQVVTKGDIDELIKIMGTVDDIIREDTRSEAGEGEEDGKPRQDKSGRKEYQTGRRLYRNPDDVVIAGVCSGLAAFFGIDPVIVRLLFAISVFFGGAGVIIYIVLWVVMPEAKTGAQKLEMQGDAVTLEKLEQAAKEKSSRIRKMDVSGVRRFISLPFRFLGALFRVFGRVARKFAWVVAAIVGLAIMIGTIFAMTATGLTAATLIFNLDSPYIHSDIPLAEMVQSVPEFYLGVISLFIVIFVPLVFILLLGSALVSRKNTFRAASNSVLIGIWMIAVIVFGVVALDTAPVIQGRIDEYRETNPVVREFDYSDFDKVLVMDGHRATITPGDEYRISARGREADIEKLRLSVADRRLTIDQARPNGICLFCFGGSGVEFDITMPELIEITAPGASRVTAQGFEGDELNLEIYGASNADFEGNYKTINSRLSGGARLDLSASTTAITIETSGAPRINLSGTGKDLEAELFGVTKLNGFEFIAENADIMADGASQAELSVTGLLKAEADGAAKIYYRGDPAVNYITDGVGEVRKME